MTDTPHPDQIAAARAALADARARRDADATTVATLTERLEPARRGRVDDPPADVEAELADARDALAASRDAVETAETALSEARADFHDDVAVTPFDTLDGTQPVALFPVRLETRYGDVSTDGAGTRRRRLNVRVYPDDVHVDTHEERLTDAERSWGEHFWVRLWEAAGGDVDSDLRRSEPAGETESLGDDAAFASVRERAWRQVVEQFGTARGDWIVRAMRPVDGDRLLAKPPEDPSSLATLAPDSFPTVERRHDSWTRPPEARALPDHWVALLIADDQVVHEAVGDPIDGPLAVGPDPTALDAGADGDTDADAGADPSDGLSWMTEFDEAVAVGMGLELDVPADTLAAGVDRLVVLGVRGTSDPAATAETVGDLFEAHRATDGLALLDQGTPTNNTRAASSPFSPRDDPVGPAFDAAVGGDDLGGTALSDGAELSRALGLGSDADGETPFERAPGGAATTHGLARELNASLWAATWGYYIDTFLVPSGWLDGTLEDGDPAVATFLEWSDRYREHFVDFVRGRGPLPAVRVRDQPYGVLPVMAPDDWVPTEAEPLALGVDDSDARAVTQGTTVTVETDAAETALDLANYDPERDTVGAVVREVATDADGLATVATDALEGAYRLVDPAGGSDPFLTLRVSAPTPSALETDLAERLTNLRPYWEAGAESVPSLATVEANDPLDAELAELLGMEATAFGYRVRDVLGPESVAALVDEYIATLVLVGARPDESLRDSVLSSFDPDADLRSMLTAFGADTDARLGRLRFGGLAGELGDGTPGGLAPLVEESGEAIADAVDTLLTAPLSELRDGPPTSGPSNGSGTTGDDGDGTEPAASLLVGLLHHSLLVEYGATRVRLGVEYGGPSVTSVWPDREILDGDTIWDRLDDPIPGDLAAHPALAPVANDDTPPTFAEALDALRAGDTSVVDPAAPPFAPRFEESVESLERLREAPDPAALATLLTETLDLAGHRLDAWITSLATRRLYALRATQDEGTAGLHVGGYGVVEDLPTPAEAATRDPDGFVHAPSLGHATTAAILRSGALADRDDGTGDALSVDLRAERVRDAVGLLDGIRNGHTLGELLGARFERALHERFPTDDRPDADLEQYLPYFRRLAPATTGDLPASAAAPDPGPDGAGTGTVVDGLALVRRRRDAARIEDVLVGAPADLLSVADLVDDEIDRLAAAVDAVRDVLAAESVHQLANGNPDRAGASLDALSRGEVPPDLDVVETPRSGTGVTNRLLVLFGDDAGGEATAAGWLDPAGDAEGADYEVRTGAEPGLSDWAATLLPDPDSVVCTATYRWPDPTADPDDASDPASGPATDDSPVPSADADDVPTVEHTVEATVADLELSPLDVLAEAIGDDQPAASTLERRFEYVLRRDRPTHADAGTADGLVPADATIDLAFERDPNWGVDRVSVSEFLEAVRALRELVASARPADAVDLALPEEARGDNADRVPSTTGDLDRGDLVDRADATITPLRTTAHDLGVVRDATTTGPDAPAAARTPVAHLRALVDRLATLSETVDPTAIEALSTALDSLDPTAVRRALERTLETVSRGPVIVVSATAEGDLGLRPAPDQRVAGATTLPARTPIEVSLRAADPATLDVTRRVEVADDGTFALPLDLDDVPAGTQVTLRVTVEVSDPATATTYPEARRTTRGSRELTIAVKGRLDPRSDPIEPSLAAVVERDFPPLATLLDAAGTVAALEAAGGDEPSLAGLIEDLPAGVLRALATALAARGAWDDATAAARLVDLLALGTDPIPGVTDDEGDAAIWTAVTTVARTMAETPLSTRDALAELTVALEGAVRGRGRLRDLATMERRLDAFLADTAPGAARLAALTPPAAPDEEPLAAFDAALATFSRRTLLQASYLGVSGSVPVAAVGDDAATAARLTAQVRAVVGDAEARASAIPDATAPFVSVEATGAAGYDLSGWAVVTDDGRTYRFAPGTTVDGGERLTLHTGPGDDARTDRYWPVGPHGDTDGTVTLSDARGRVVSQRGPGAPTEPLPDLVEVVAVDATGADDGDSGTPADESVTMENVAAESLDLTGWTVGDRAGHRFRFPDGFTLASGARVTVHTGEGDDDAGAVFWGRAAAVWNDHGDIVTVRDAHGRVVERAVFPELPAIERPTPVVLATARTASPGDPTGERLRFRNTGPDSVDIGDWTVGDRVGHVYRIPEGTTLAAGAAIDLRTGDGTDSRTTLFWGRDSAVWNDRGDTVVVRDEADAVVLAEAVFGDSRTAGAGELSIAPHPRGPPEPLAASAYVEQIRACLGEGFTVLPQFTPSSPAETAAALAPSHAAQLLGDDPLAAETWFDRVAQVREGAERLHRGFAYAEAFSGGPVRDLQVAQLPFDPTDQWIGLPSDSPPPGGRLSMVAHVRGSLSETAPMTGLFVDEWVDVIPSTTETTGVSFQYDAPAARAPQSILLAVPSDPSAGWSRETLLATVTEALDLASLRLADGQSLPGVGQLFPALAVPTNDGDPPGAASLDLDRLLAADTPLEGPQ